MGMENPQPTPESELAGFESAASMFLENIRLLSGLLETVDADLSQEEREAVAELGNKMLKLHATAV